MTTLPPDDDDLSRLEALLIDFDLNWSPQLLEATHERLTDFPNRSQALGELVKIDCERNRRSGRPIGLENYVERFPELLVDGQPLADLVAAIEEIQREPVETAMPPGATPMQIGSVQLPKEFGRYRIIRPLGRGGMGGVYLAKDRELDRLVALKVPRFQRDDAALFDRFTREAQAAAAIDHPGICRVYDVGRVDGVPYLSMSYIEGPSLLDELNKGPLPIHQAVAYARAIAAAMAEAHRLGVVHRDLKPANILLSKDDTIPIVTDFGLARREIAGDTRLTDEGVVLGTPMYMSPEQVSGERAGPATDIYSLGVILYEMLTGKPPFEGSRTEIFAGTIGNPPEPPSARRPEIDARLNLLVGKALAKKPADRFASMDDFAESLEGWLKGEAKSSRPVPATRWYFVLAIVAFGAIGAVAVYLNWNRSQPREVSDPPPDRSEPVGPKLERERSLADEGDSIGAISLVDGGVVQIGLRGKDGLVTPRRYAVSNGDAALGQVGIDAGQWLVFRAGGILIRPANSTVVEYRAMSNGRLLHTFNCGAASIAAWSLSGRVMAIGLTAAEARVAVFEGRTNVNLDQYRGHQGEIRALALSDDGQYVYSASADRHCLREVKTGRIEREAGSNRARCAAFLRNRSTVAIGYETGEVVLLNGMTDQELSPKHGEAVLSVAVCRDGQLFVTGSRDGSVIGWSLATGSKLWQSSKLPGPVTAIDISADGKRMAVATGAAWQVWQLP